MRNYRGRVLLMVLLMLAAQSALVAATRFEIREDQKDFISIDEGSVPVFRYVRGEILPTGAPEDRRRSTYVDPLYSLDGKPLTDDGPKDHYHHRGLSWMWAVVSFDKVTKDLWTLKGIRQHYESHQAKALDDRAVLRVKNYWQEDSTKRRLLNETVTLAALRSDGAGRIIDYELELAAVDTPVSIGVSHRGYSGLTLRFAPRRDTIITASKGVVDKDVDRQRYTWADLSAVFGQSRDYDGITIFDNQSNPHFPCGWTLRSYGMLNPAFTSTSTDYTIEPGKPLTLRYRIYVHRGKADPSKLQKVFDEYYRGGATAWPTAR